MVENTNTFVNMDAKKFNEALRDIRVTWKGTKTIILHSCQCVNPLNPIAIELKKYTSKRNKTDEDNRMISDLDFKGGLYWDDNIGVYIPAENIEATIVNGAKAFKKGSAIQKFCNVVEFRVPLEYGAKLTMEELMADYTYRDVRVMTVNRARVNRTRPRFNRWAITFTLRYDSSKIDFETIKNAIEYAGLYVGLCDSRPKYGTFESIMEELN